MVLRKNGFFAEEEQKQLYNALYDISLNKILEHAHQFAKAGDYYQMRDESNNGWDVFYYGFANRENVTKNAKAFMVVNGWQVGDKISFSKEDTQKILEKIGSEPYDGSTFTIKMS